MRLLGCESDARGMRVVRAGGRAGYSVKRVQVGVCRGGIVNVLVASALGVLGSVLPRGALISLFLLRVRIGTLSFALRGIRRMRLYRRCAVTSGYGSTVGSYRGVIRVG